MRLLSATATLPENMSFRAESLAEVINLLNEKRITRETAKAVFEKAFLNGVIPSEYIKQNHLELQNDAGEIARVAAEVVENNPKAVGEYLAGKEKAIGFLIGQAMKRLGGKASPNDVAEYIRKKLSEIDS